MTDDSYHSELARKLRMDLSNAQSKLTELIRWADTIEKPTRRSYPCPHCGDLGYRGQHQLDDHLYTSHDGPLPAHQAAVDDLILEPQETDDGHGI